MLHSKLIIRCRIGVLSLCGFLLPATMLGAPDAGSVAKGKWGGEHVLMDITEKGADLEFDCAHGELTQTLTVDKGGDFAVDGTFSPEHGGPVRRDEVPKSTPAHYAGHVDGSNMTLTVTVGKEVVGVFHLSRGAEPGLTKCV